MASKLSSSARCASLLLIIIQPIPCFAQSSDNSLIRVSLNFTYGQVLQEKITNNPFDVLEVFKENWTPYWTLESIFRAICYLLTAPNPDSPLNCDAGNLIRKGDMQGYLAMAKMYTKEMAIDKKEIKNFLETKN